MFPWGNVCCSKALKHTYNNSIEQVLAFMRSMKAFWLDVSQRRQSFESLRYIWSKKSNLYNHLGSKFHTHKIISHLSFNKYVLFRSKTASNTNYFTRQKLSNSYEFTYSRSVLFWWLDKKLIPLLAVGSLSFPAFFYCYDRLICNYNCHTKWSDFTSCYPLQL